MGEDIGKEEGCYRGKRMQVNRKRSNTKGKCVRSKAARQRQKGKKPGAK